MGEAEFRNKISAWNEMSEASLKAAAKAQVSLSLSLSVSLSLCLCLSLFLSLPLSVCVRARARARVHFCRSYSFTLTRSRTNTQIMKLNKMLRRFPWEPDRGTGYRAVELLTELELCKQVE